MYCGIRVISCTSWILFSGCVGCSVWAGRILELAVEAAGLRLACPALAAVAVDGSGLRLEFLNLAAQLKFSVRLPLGAACSLGTRSKRYLVKTRTGKALLVCSFCTPQLSPQVLCAAVHCCGLLSWPSSRCTAAHAQRLRQLSGILVWCCSGMLPVSIYWLEL